MGTIGRVGDDSCAIRFNRLLILIYESSDQIGEGAYLHFDDIPYRFGHQAVIPMN